MHFFLSVKLLTDRSPKGMLPMLSLLRTLIVSLFVNL